MEPVLNNWFFQGFIRNNAQRENGQCERPRQPVNEFECVDDVLPRLNRVIDNPVVGGVDLVLPELRQRMDGLLNLRNGGGTLVELQNAFAAALDSHTDTVHA